MKAVNKSMGHNSCISEKMLLEYAHGELDANQEHLVERHLIDCELCTDALEGLMLIKTAIGQLKWLPRSSMKLTKK